jgi:hypothetical protein
MANLVYNEAKKQILNGSIDLDTSTIKVMLVKSTYTANADHAAIDDGTADDPKSHELTVSGYARQTLANRSVASDVTNDFAYLDADDTVFTALATGEMIGGAIILKDSGVDTTSIPIAFYDLTDTPTNGSDITVQWNTAANGAVLKAA